MSYQVIARKWRPQAFAEVTGQEHITKTLVNGLKHDRLHHSYIFTGVRGVGKTTTARLLAKAVNCGKGERPAAEPCRNDDPEACLSCREVTAGRSMDVAELDAASNTGVDNIREAIIQNVGVRPSRDRYRVFIIDEVHMLSTAAFNALLKTLEEPPPFALFILATTHAHKLPDTITSRSQLFEFRLIPTGKIVDRLRLIAQAEGVMTDVAALWEVARAGAGSMRDAQSAFDQVISFTREAGSIMTATDVREALGVVGAEVLQRTLMAVAEGNSRGVLGEVEELCGAGHELRNYVRSLMEYVRDLTVFKVAGVVPDARPDEQEQLLALSERLSESDLVRIFHSLINTDQLLREAAHPRYILELGLVKLVEMRRLAPLGDIVRRLQALEAKLTP